MLLALDGKTRVLGVTQYLHSHPGGAKIISRLGGTDISRPFEQARRRSSAHKARIRSLAQCLFRAGPSSADRSPHARSTSTRAPRT